MDETKRPQYVLDVENHLGLKTRKNTQYANRWCVLSPTGVCLFEIEGELGVIGMMEFPDMYEMQGISRDERMRRRVVTGGIDSE